MAKKKKRKLVAPAASNLAGQRVQQPRPATAKQKKLARLKEGFPLASGRTPKEVGTSAPTTGAIAARKIIDSAGNREIKRAQRKLTRKKRTRRRS